MSGYNGLQLADIGNDAEFRNNSFLTAKTFSRGNGLKMVYRKLSKDNRLSIRQKASIRFGGEERKVDEHRSGERLFSCLITNDCPGEPR